MPDTASRPEVTGLAFYTVGMTPRILGAALLLTAGLAACGGTNPDDTAAISKAVGTDANLKLGESLYTANCARCHGATGAGGAGPSLHNRAAETRFAYAEDNITWVENGGGSMPGFKDSLTSEQIAAVTKFARDVLGSLKS